jgi:glycosyltransferase involved in cell wall biosynthesis
VRAQTVPPHEILVVDGRSTDDTPAVAREFGARLVTQTDDGLPSARNLGIANASGDLIAFLDGDDLWAPQKLELQLAAMRADPALEYTTTLVQLVLNDDASPEWRARAGVELVRSVPTTSSLVARRELFQRLGTYDPGFMLSCDPDWFTRARDANISTRTIPHVLTYKRLHGKNLSNLSALTRHDMFRVARDSIARQRDAGTARPDA